MLANLKERDRLDNYYALLADLIGIFHFLYVVFAVGGQIFIMVGWFARLSLVRRPSFRLVHLVAVVLVALEATLGLMCPLTQWEYGLRRMAGQRVDSDLSFIARLVHSVVFYDFPDWVFTIAHVSFGALVVSTFILMPPTFRRRVRS